MAVIQVRQCDKCHAQIAPEARRFELRAVLNSLNGTTAVISLCSTACLHKVLDDMIREGSPSVSVEIPAQGPLTRRTLSAALSDTV